AVREPRDRSTGHGRGRRLPTERRQSEGDARGSGQRTYGADRIVGGRRRFVPAAGFQGGQVLMKGDTSCVVAYSATAAANPRGQAAASTSSRPSPAYPSASAANARRRNRSGSGCS